MATSMSNYQRVLKQILRLRGSTAFLHIDSAGGAAINECSNQSCRLMLLQQRKVWEGEYSRLIS